MDDEPLEGVDLFSTFTFTFFFFFDLSLQYQQGKGLGLQIPSIFKAKTLLAFQGHSQYSHRVHLTRRAPQGSTISERAEESGPGLKQPEKQHLTSLALLLKIHVNCATQCIFIISPMPSNKLTLKKGPCLSSASRNSLAHHPCLGNCLTSLQKHCPAAVRNIPIIFNISTQTYKIC